jgi:hypothetical protein
MIKKALEFEIPQSIGCKKISNLEIPIYGFVFQSEESAWEMAIADYQRENEENKSGSTPNVKSTNRIAAAILAERVNPSWTAHDVESLIPWNFATKIYEIFLEERSYDAKKKEEQEALEREILKAEIMKELASTSDDSSLPTGEKSDTV